MVSSSLRLAGRQYTSRAAAAMVSSYPRPVAPEVNQHLTVSMVSSSPRLAGRRGTSHATASMAPLSLSSGRPAVIHVAVHTYMCVSICKNVTHYMQTHLCMSKAIYVPMRVPGLWMTPPPTPDPQIPK